MALNEYERKANKLVYTDCLLGELLCFSSGLFDLSGQTPGLVLTIPKNKNLLQLRDSGHT